MTIFLIRSDGHLQHLTVAEVPSLRRLPAHERVDLARELVADVGCVIAQRDGDEPADGDTAIDGEW